MNISDSNFEDIITGELPVMVDFWAPWCGPCRMISPVVEELSDEYQDNVLICKCNVDDNDEAPLKYAVRNIPTLLFFKDGKLVDRLVGAVSKQDIVNKLNALL